MRRESLKGQTDIHTDPRTTRHLGTSLPLTWNEGPSYPAAAFLTLFGGFWTGFSLWALHAFLTDGRSADSWTDPVLAAGFAAIGAVMFLAGLNGFFMRTFIRIDASEVRYKHKALIWGIADWREPLSAFRGVLATHKQRSSENKPSERVVYEIHLKHRDDPDRDVQLYRSRRSRGHRALTELFASLLGLPVLTEREEGGYDARDASDLEKSVWERAAAGSLRTPAFNPAVIPVDSRLRVRKTADGYALEASLRPLLPLALIFSVMGFGLLYLYLGPGGPEGEGPEWVVLVAGGVFALVGTWLVHVSLFKVERLEVSPEGVCLGWVEPGRPLDPDHRSSMRTDEIEEVGPWKDKWGRFRLAVRGDEQRLTWGQHLSREERRLASEAILEVLTRRRP